MQANLDLVQIDLHNFFTVSTDFSNLAIKINGIPTNRATRNNDTDHLGFLLHDSDILSRNGSKMLKSDCSGGILASNIIIFSEKTIPPAIKKNLPLMSGICYFVLLNGWAGPTNALSSM